MVAPVVCVALDQGMGHPRHLGGDGGVGLAFQIGVMGVPPDVAFELPAEAVLSLADGRGGGQPVGVAQPGVAPLGELIATLGLAALAGGEVKATEFQVLAVMAKAAQVAAFCQDDQGDDGPYSRKGLQPGDSPSCRTDGCRPAVPGSDGAG